MKRALVVLALSLCACAPAAAGSDGGARRRDGGGGPVCTQGGDSPAAVVSMLIFSKEDPMGVTEGFDVDGVVSTGVDNGSCRRKDFVDSAGRPGIDNQLAVLVPVLENLVQNAVDLALQAAINNGQLLIALELEQVDDYQDDGCVRIRVRAVDAAAQVGPDQRLQPGQTFYPKAGTEMAMTEGRIEDGFLLAGPFELPLPVAILDARFTLHVHNAYLRTRLGTDWSMREGVIGGGVEVEELKQIAGGLTIPTNTRETVNSGIAAFADLERQGGACTQLSVAVRFEAASAFVEP